MPRLSRLYKVGSRLPEWNLTPKRNHVQPWVQPTLDGSRSQQLQLKFQGDESTPHFRVGQKAVYLPQFTLSLVRDEKLSPYFAKFLVPLWFSKLDLRDYLFHGYNVRAFNIRSNVVQRPYETADWTNPTKPQRRFFRRKAIKFMIIEMDKPFLWPKPLEDWDGAGFDKTAWDANESESEYGQRYRETKIPWNEGSDVLLEPQVDGKPPNATKTMKDVREALAGDAARLLEGKVKWSPTWKTMSEMFSLPRRDGSRTHKN